MHHMTQMNFDGRPAGDWCRSYVRALLCGEPLPEAYRTFAAREQPICHLSEFYKDLKDHNRADELFAAVGRLYLVDRLVRGINHEGGITNSVHGIEFGSVYEGKTQIHLEYVIQSRYGTEEFEVDVVTGEVVLEESRPKRPIRDWRRSRIDEVFGSLVL